MLNTDIPAYLVNTMPVYPRVPQVVRASAGKVLGVYDRQYVGLLHGEFG